MADLYLGIDVSDTNVHACELSNSEFEGHGFRHVQDEFTRYTE